MSLPAATADAVLIDRYGRRRATELLGRPPRERAGSHGGPAVRRLARRAGPLTGALAGIAVVLAWVAWASAGHDPGSVSSQLVAFDPPLAQSVSVTFSVSRPKDTAVACVLDATDRAGDIVGRAVVTVPGGRSGEQRVTTVVRTTSTALNVTVDGCQLPGHDGLN